MTTPSRSKSYVKIISWAAPLLTGVILALLWSTGAIYYVFAWCEQNIGGWFPPVALSAMALPFILVPFFRGVRLGMKEANAKADAA